MVKKILLVDDDAINLKLCSATFEKTLAAVRQGNDYVEFPYRRIQIPGIKGLKAEDGNLEVVCVIDPMTVFQCYDLAEIILVVVDINMPIMNGFEFIEEIGRVAPAIQVVVHTSSIDVRDIERARRYPNVLDFMFKPMNHEMALVILRHASKLREKGA